MFGTVANRALPGCKYICRLLRSEVSIFRLRKECHRYQFRLHHAVILFFECSNISFNENKLDGVDLNSNGLDCFIFGVPAG